MLLDIRTLVFCDLLITAFLASALIFYRATQKTYAGFDHWALGTVTLGVGYLALVLRGHHIPAGASILLVNALFATGALLRLDAVLRFARRTALPTASYLSVPVLVAFSAWFYWMRDDLIVRSAAISVWVAVVCVAIVAAVLRADRRNSMYGAFALLHGVYALVLAARVASWVGSAEAGVFAATPLNITLYAGVTVLEVGIGVAFFMLHSQRVELELVESKTALDASLRELKTTMSELKVLGGLLPICAHCKKVRDDKGYWQQVEVYIKAHTHAEFSHGICPECVEKHYGDLPDEAEATGP